MVNRAKQKGTRNEVKIVQLHNDCDIQCTRVPFSGSAGHLREDLQHDVSIKDGRFKGEVKSRAKDSGFKRIKEWLGEADILFIVEDRKDPIVVMPWHTYVEIWHQNIE